jgi:hypothetical protein
MSVTYQLLITNMRIFSEGKESLYHPLITSVTRRKAKEHWLAKKKKPTLLTPYHPLITSITIRVCLAPGHPAPGCVRTHLRKWHPRTKTAPACVRPSPSAAYLLHTPIPPQRCHLRRAPSASPLLRPLYRPLPQRTVSRALRRPLPRHAAPHSFRAARGGAAQATRGEGRTAPPFQKDSVTTLYGCPTGFGRDNAVEGGGRDATPDLLVKHPNTIVATYV